MQVYPLVQVQNAGILHYPSPPPPSPVSPARPSHSAAFSSFRIKHAERGSGPQPIPVWIHQPRSRLSNQNRACTLRHVSRINTGVRRTILYCIYTAYNHLLSGQPSSPSPGLLYTVKAPKRGYYSVYQL